MCLVVKKENFEVKVAEKDIKCFKVMAKIDRWSFSSMCQNFTYRFQNYKRRYGFSNSVENLENAYRVGCRYEDGSFSFFNRCFEEVAMILNTENIEEYYCFGEGGFHSFADLEKSDVFGTFVGVECSIPKGSRYIEGIDESTNKKAYFSENITIVREIKIWLK